MTELDSLTESVLASVAEDPSAPELDATDSLSEGHSVEQGATTASDPTMMAVHTDVIDPELVKEDRRRSISYGRVGKLAHFLAQALGQPPSWQDEIRTAARLHDIGKVAVPKEILNKPGPLTEEEYEQVKEHTVIGAYLLSSTMSTGSDMAARIARSHHERWDGDGYPDGLAGEEIPLEARIVGVADTIDAMTQDRPYRDALPIERAFEVIEEEAGAEFDPRISEAVLRHRDKIASLV